MNKRLVKITRKESPYTPKKEANCKGHKYPVSDKPTGLNGSPEKIKCLAPSNKVQAPAKAKQNKLLFSFSSVMKKERHPHWMPNKRATKPSKG